MNNFLGLAGGFSNRRNKLFLLVGSGLGRHEPPRHTLGNMPEDISSKEAAQYDDHHAPEGDRNKSADLECRVQGNKEWTKGTEENVKTEPVLHRAD